MRPLLIVCIILTGCTRVFSQDSTCDILWDAPILLSDTNYEAHSPKIALSGNDTVHVTYWGGGLKLPYLRSTTAGISWEQQRELLLDSIRFWREAAWAFLVTDEQEVYIFFVGGDNGYNETPVRMIMSTNGGTTWDRVRDIGFDTVGLIQSVAISKNTIAIIEPSPTAYRNILRSTDGGDTWTKTTEDLPKRSRVGLTTSALHLVYQRRMGPVGEIEYRFSNNLGDTWKQTKVLSTIDSIWSDEARIAARDSTVIIAWRDQKKGCLGILGCSVASRTGVTGADSTNWNIEEILTDLPRGYPTDVGIHGMKRAAVWEDELVPNKVFHVAVKVSQSANPSVWCPTIDITPAYNREVIDPQIAVSDKAVHVVWAQSDAPSPSTFRIYYRRGVFQTTEVRKEENKIPEAMTLSQNYPNPFNSKTKIGFGLQVSGFTSVKVYDIFGREVATLVNEKLQAGEHEVEWNSSAVASGVYYYRLVVQSEKGKVYTETKKMVLLQ